MKALTYDEFIEDSDWCKHSYFHRMYVLIDGEEYAIKNWYPECEAVEDPSDPDLREEENHRIVFEIERNK